MKIISGMVFSGFASLLLSSCATVLDREHSIEQLVARAKLNFADYEITRVYDVCPSWTRRYLVAFKSVVRYDLDLEKSPLRMKKDAATGQYTVYAPAIEMDENVGSKPYSRNAWSINGSLWVNDQAQAEKQKEHIEAYALYLASKRLETDELKAVFTEKVKQLVSAISLGAGNEIKNSNIKVVFDKGNYKSYKLPDLNRCKRGEITW